MKEMMSLNRSGSDGVTKVIVDDLIHYNSKFIKVKSIECLKDTNYRLFYELGYKLNIRLGIDNRNWIRHGLFYEIIDIDNFIKNDKRLNDVKYILHHNFQKLPNK